MSPLATALLPLRRYADFRGRSTRTELIFFYLLTAVVGAAIGFAGSFIDFGAGDWMTFAFDLAILCPTLALSVRRLHDTGRTGWWLLLFLPASAAGAWSTYLDFRHPVPFPELQPELPLAVILPTALAALALLVLLLWDDELEANRYGPNPRYGAPEVTA